MANTSKVTLSCRVQPEQKLEIAKRANELGLSICQYVEALVLQNHKELKIDDGVELKWEDVDMLLPEDLRVVYRDFMDKLKERFPDHSEQQILTATLAHGFKNQGALIQRNLSNFLKKLESNYYTLKTEK